MRSKQFVFWGLLSLYIYYPEVRMKRIFRKSFSMLLVLTMVFTLFQGMGTAVFAEGEDKEILYGGEIDYAAQIGASYYETLQAAVNNAPSNPEDATDETVAYFKRNEPIGCRDFHTLEFLKGKGISAYFSGCMTLTLGRTYRVPESDRTEDIYFVDYRIGENERIDKVLYPVLNARKRRCRCYYRTHYYPLGSDVQGGLREAESLVREYARAGLVITRNIHCALPCLALGTPVIFVIPKFDSTRFHGLIDFFNYAGINEKGEFVCRIDADACGRVRNPEKHLPYAAHLEKIAAMFGGGADFAGIASKGVAAAVPRAHYPEAESETGLWRRFYHKRRIGKKRRITLLGTFTFEYERS